MGGFYDAICQGIGEVTCLGIVIIIVLAMVSQIEQVHDHIGVAGYLMLQPSIGISSFLIRNPTRRHRILG